MPANEQTWRDTKLLHKVFGVTSALMLIATIWMFAADHNREWKPVQRTANRAEMTLTDWRRFQFQTDENRRVAQQLESQLQAARRQSIDEGLLRAFEQEVASDSSTKGDSFSEIHALEGELRTAAGKPEAEAVRQELVDSLKAIIRQARFREDTLLGERKFKSADRDAAVATLGLLVRDHRDAKELDAKQAEVDELKRELDSLSTQYERAKEHRVDLDNLLKQMTKDETTAHEALVDNQLELKTLNDSNVERRSTFFTWFAGVIPLPGKRWLELPIFDAFNSPRKIDNHWSTGNTIDYNFSEVRRFDRCTTCHQMIQKTLPGSAVEPAYNHDYFVDFQIVPQNGSTEAGANGESPGATPPASESVTASHTDDEKQTESQRLAAELERIVGVKIAAEGLLEENDATVQFVRPQSPAAAARALSVDHEQQMLSGDQIANGLLTGQSGVIDENPQPGLVVGDVIVAVDQSPATHANKVAATLLDTAIAGKPFRVTVRRGMPNPYTSHPRLDLFVGSLSPHKLSEFACTICHEGQGSATAFRWASHSPNSVRQRQDWTFNRGWADNPHWIFPMYPQRFAESACLKCHHQVAELEASEKFPEPPAPKVVHGFHLVRKYGCYGCHEINGYDGKRSVGPDLRLEPNVFAAAQQILVDPGYEKLTDDYKDWINQLIDHPDREAVRRRLLEVLEGDAAASSPVLSADTHNRITPLLRDVESPGQLRKAGPSLRYVAHKLDPVFLSDWVREPKRFRPNTRMPQFFGLWKHLQGSPGIVEAKQYEPLEILGIATYLQKRSQPFRYLEPPQEVNLAADPARGRIQFQTRGCLACHTHKSFADADAYRPQGEIVQGPDLSGVGDKFVGENQRKWLYSWIRQPSLYHPRTVMPDLFLEPIKNAEGQVSDPAADIVAYLVQDSRVQWEPKPDSLASPEQANPEDLDRFVKMNLAEAFATHRADQYARTGVPESMRGELKGAEIELVVPAATQSEPGFKLSAEQKLLYIGRKSIGKHGCYGCHDIPGFEDAKPIGTTMADWGRKDSARLAFEHISHYLEHGHGTAGHDTAGHRELQDDATVILPGSQAVPPGPSVENAAGHTALPAGDGEFRSEMSAAYLDETDADNEYYLEQISAGHRAGFLYQKLREPRSYDYHKTENKRYNERLRMPEFPFTSADREAVATFILGLVADPPADKYLFRPTERSAAIYAGRQVLEKYNCGGCHILSPETWQIAAKPDRFAEQPTAKAFPFTKTHFTPQELLDSAKLDRSGLVRAMVRGVPTIADNGIPIAYDDVGDPIDPDTKYDSAKLELPFDLWFPAVVSGHPYDVGVLPINVLSGDIQQRADTDGGFLSKYLLPRVVALEKQVNPAAKGNEAWGWLPPPLKQEGEKVQPDWLHSFLLNPYTIRPATFLRMPRFNMTPAEATKLVNYFAAVDSVEYPYAFESRQQSGHLADEEVDYQQATRQANSTSEPRSRFDDAMRAVVNNNYCVKCHLVEDFEPTGSDRAKAPNLAQVYRRLRPDYLRRWIANPKSILPYTSMPINIPYDPDAPNLGGIAQDLYHGTSVDQVDALVDLLMNFDDYAKQRNSITDLVKEFGGPPAAADGTVTPPPAGQTAPGNPATATSATAPSPAANASAENPTEAAKPRND